MYIENSRSLTKKNYTQYAEEKRRNYMMCSVKPMKARKKWMAEKEKTESKTGSRKREENEKKKKKRSFSSYCVRLFFLTYQ